MNYRQCLTAQAVSDASSPTLADHGVYAIHLHIYFVTKYRRKFFTAPLIERMMQSAKAFVKRTRAKFYRVGTLAEFHA
jgi:REP element-mobilizing transposase RayT